MKGQTGAVDRGHAKFFGTGIQRTDAIPNSRQIDRRAARLAWIGPMARGEIQARVPVPESNPAGPLAGTARKRNRIAIAELAVRLFADPFVLARLEASGEPMPLEDLELAPNVTPAGVRAVYATLAASAVRQAAS